ncbi:MAG: hypothetical protein ACF8GE_02305 [Phycisphaerales bacterium JB043]
MRSPITLMIAALALAAHASEADRLREGNLMVTTGHLEEALVAYGTPDNTDTPRLRLARAIAQAQLGQTEEAQLAIQELLEQPLHDTLAWRAHKTRGAMYLTLGAAAFSQSPPESIPNLETALAHYTRAHALDRSDIDSARNIEFIRRMLDAARTQEQQNQQQQQQQQQQNQQMADQLDQLADQQQQESDENNQQQQSQQQQQQDQQSLNQQTQSSAEQLDKQQDQSEAQEALDRAQQAQQRAQEALERGDLDEAAEHQQEAADALREAAEQLRQDQQQESEPNEQQQEQPSEEQQETESLADRLIQREEDSREQRTILKPRPIRVPKDW